MEQDTQVKSGRPLGSIKTEYDRGDKIITLPQPGAGIFLIVSHGKVIEMCSSENIHRYARQRLFSHEKVIRDAVETGDIEFIVIHRQEEYDPVELARCFKLIQHEALEKKYLK